MNKKLKVKQSIQINASPQKVWQVMTDPELIAIYLYGTKTETDWEIGSPIAFSGEYEGMVYVDRGIVMANVKEKLLAYDYWSQFSGLEDIPENYCEVSYHIDDNKDGSVKFSWQQIGFKDEESLNHSQSGLPSLLEQIKKIAEE